MAFLSEFLEGTATGGVFAGEEALGVSATVFCGEGGCIEEGVSVEGDFDNFLEFELADDFEDWFPMSFLEAQWTGA